MIAEVAINVNNGNFHFHRVTTSIILPPWKLVEASVEEIYFHLLPWKQIYFQFTSMEAGGSFQGSDFLPWTLCGESLHESRSKKGNNMVGPRTKLQVASGF